MSESSTQNAQILRHLREYKTITSLEAVEKYRIMRLASRVAELKRRGYTIASEYVKNGKSHYVVYHLQD